MIDNIRAIIFDYGGTLDSRGDHWSEVIRRAYEAEGLRIPHETFRDAYVHAERALDGSGIILPDDNYLAVMRKKIVLQFKHLGIGATTPSPLTTQHVTHLPAITPLAEAVATRCYESARECVRESAETLARLAAHYPIGIVSNFYGNVRAVLDDFGLTPMLTAVIDSTAIGIRKPDP
ncbi:MAG: HAD family hydrolase, partial [Duncaniella sp.]|nr:HAD family hydrolase [Duncaniella sp.]